MPLIKRKKKDFQFANYGTFRHAFQTRVYDPREFYHMRLDYLKKKRAEKYDSKVCSSCGKKAEYVDGRILKKYYCEKCKNKK